MNLITKIKWIVGVTGVFLLILATNLIDKDNFARLEETVDNIYNDRLLAKEVLLDITLKFHQKELAYSRNDSSYLSMKNDRINEEISQSLQIFNRLESTREEEQILNSLIKNHENLIKLESNLSVNETLYSPKCKEIFSRINDNISDLAAEQIRGGKNQKFIAKKAIEQTNLYYQMEIYFLIFLGIIIQILILYKPKNS